MVKSKETAQTRIMRNLTRLRQRNSKTKTDDFTKAKLWLESIPEDKVKLIGEKKVKTKPTPIPKKSGKGKKFQKPRKKPSIVNSFGALIL